MLIMTVLKHQKYIIYSFLLLPSVYYVASTPIQNNENKLKTIAESKDVDVNSDSVTSYNNIRVKTSTTTSPLPLLLVFKDDNHRVKRAIDANQGSSWLKFVWRERKYKIPQMFLTNIRNIWAVDPAGGRHLFDPGVPYGSVYLLKTLLLDVMFPRIGKNQ